MTLKYPISETGDNLTLCFPQGLASLRVGYVIAGGRGKYM